MFNKLVRIGKNSELRSLPNGTPVLSFPAVYDIGFGQNKKAQWLDCTMFGDRATKVVDYILKGKQIVIYAEDVRIDEWDKPDGSKGFKLACKLVSFDFVSDGTGGQQQAPQQQEPQYQPPAQANPAQNMQDDFDSDIPF
jgi:single-strand DNA-binding protein